ncbi:TPA: cytochrome c biogenesis protein CcdA [Candidatus Woesearchaeota archaeon]|nr:cytochrome c biogenesis protein CcdA [Candidatus Woesearchaeota archaeon]
MSSLFILVFLLVAVVFASADHVPPENGDEGIAKQLSVLEKISDYNRATAESTLRNVSFLIAFLGGVLSFLAPCSVALLPAFLAYTAKSGRNITVATLTFFSGFSAAFIAIGVALTALGRVSFVTFQQDFSVLVQAAGVIMVFLGVLMALGKGFSFIRLRSRIPKDAPGMFLFGALFAIGWSACIGPIIAGIFTMAAVFHNYAYTALLLFFYSLGLAIPLFIAAFTLDRIDISKSRLLRGFLVRMRIGGREVLLSSTNLMAGALLAFIGLFFIFNKGTTAITAADLMGMIGLLTLLGLAAIAVHKLAVARLIKNSGLRKAVAIAEIAAVTAAFAYLTHAYQFRTTGLAERLSNAVLGHPARYGIIAAALLAAFGAALLYFLAKKPRGDGK